MRIGLQHRRTLANAKLLQQLGQAERLQTFLLQRLVMKTNPCYNQFTVKKRDCVWVG